MSATVIIDLYPTQDDFVHDAHRYTAFIGGRNSGKTFSGSCKAVQIAMRGGLGCIAAPTFPMLEHGAKQQFIDRLDEIGIAYTKTRDSVVLTGRNSEIIFVTLESESRVRGPNYAWGWADEVEYVTDRNIWKAFKGAIRDGDNPQLFVTSTPKGRRLVWDEWVVGKTAHHALYKATTYDNPFIAADDYVAGLGYEGVFYDQEISADFVTFEGLVYPKFNRETHVQTVDCDGWGTVLAMDMGTRNPTAILVLRFAGDRIHVEREFYERGLGSDSITDAAVSFYGEYRPEFMVIDPSAAGLITSLSERGIPVRKAVNDVVVGINTVTARMDDLTVDPSCANVIEEFESYRYPGGNRTAIDTPVKEHDHAMDALRYGVMQLGNVVTGSLMA